MIKELICINCPLGCHLMVDDTDKNNIKVTGNTCPRGSKYGIDEVTNPKRMVTSSVTVIDGTQEVVSVKTKEAISKALVFDCLSELKNVKLQAPVKIGDVVISNVLNTGVDVIVTSNVNKK